MPDHAIDHSYSQQFGSTHQRECRLVVELITSSTTVMGIQTISTIAIGESGEQQFYISSDRPDQSGDRRDAAEVDERHNHRGRASKCR